MWTLLVWIISTICYVLEDNRPILYVFHDEDGDWQFLCSSSSKITQNQKIGRSNFIYN